MCIQGNTAKVTLCWRPRFPLLLAASETLASPFLHAPSALGVPRWECLIFWPQGWSCSHVHDSTWRRDTSICHCSAEEDTLQGRPGDYTEAGADQQCIRSSIRSSDGYQSVALGIIQIRTKRELAAISSQAGNCFLTVQQHRL